MNRPTADDAFVRGLDAWIDATSSNGGAWSAELRRNAGARFVGRGLPTSKDEDWRHTPLKSLTRVDRPVLDGPGHVAPEQLERFAVPGLDAVRVVLVDGFLVPGLGDLDRLPEGLDVLDLYEALGSERALLEPALSRDAGDASTSFESLNAAWCRGGVVIRARNGAAVERPVHLLHVSTVHDTSSMTHPRIVLRGERSSQFTVIEDHVALEGSDEFVNLVTEISLAENARLDHVKLVRTTPGHVHLASVRCTQQRDSWWRSVGVVFEGELVRNEIRARLEGVGAEATVNGLVVLDEAQVVDNHLWVVHAAPRARSSQHFRNVLDGSSRAVFSGRVVVEEGASGTDAQQNNANLLLSEQAQVNTLPQLEIYNDDVKASHGATLGQLDRDGLFYLRSRGIEEATARGLLTFAFANTVVETIGLAPVRELLRRQVFEHLPHADLSEELV